MKKFLAWIALVPLISIAYTSSDLSNATFLVQKGIITQQSSDAGYRLDDKITRAEVIGIALKIRWTTLPDDYQCRKYFSDTIKQDWVCRAIELASDGDLISRSNAKARPQDSITRAEAFAILFKASDLTPFKEYDTFSSMDVDASQWQKDLFVKIRNTDIEVPGTQYLSSGTPSSPYKFFPNRLATRSEIFDFGSRLLGWVTPSNQVPTSTKTITVVDWDTIHYGDLKIRMIGLDAPESNTSRYGYVECFGPEASAHLKTLLQNATDVTIEKDATQGETDKYGRTLAYIFYNGVNINTKMILDGYAFEYTYDNAYRYQSDNKNAEQVAKNAGIGLWSTSTCSGDRKKGTTAGTTTVTPTSNASYTCGTKTYCSEMTTCEEAKYYLNSCGLSRLDGDKDGTPCESVCG